MRIFIITASSEDMWQLNIAKWDLMRAILRLSQIPKQESGLGHRLRVVFERTLNPEYPERREYSGKATFHQLIPETLHDIEPASEIAMTLNPPFAVREISFWLPEGFRTEDCFNWYASEVAVLAYAMTQGRVCQVGTIAGGLEKEKDGSFVLEFDTWEDSFSA